MTADVEFADLVEAIEQSIGRSLGQERRVEVWNSATDSNCHGHADFLSYVENDIADFGFDSETQEAISEAFLAFRQVAAIRWDHPIDIMPTDAMLREDEEMNQ